MIAVGTKFNIMTTLITKRNTIVLLVFLFIGMVGQAQKQQKQYEYSIEHYQKYHKKGLVKAYTGAGMMITGATLFAISAIQNPLSGGGPLIMFFSGEIIFMVGIPFVIAGSIMARNNKKAIKTKQKDLSLSFGLTNYGIGLVMKF